MFANRQHLVVDGAGDLDAESAREADERQGWRESKRSVLIKTAGIGVPTTGP